MRFLTALGLSLAILAGAAPAIAQRGYEHGQHSGPAAGHNGGGPRWGGGGDRGGPYAAPRGGSYGGGGYGGPKGGSPYGAPSGGYYYDPRGGYPEPRGYGYPSRPPVERNGPDSLGADWGGQQDEVRAGVRQGRYVGLGRVIGTIRQRTPGRQLDAGLEQWGGRAVYRVRWAQPGGRRVDYIVDAQSGAILHVDGR